MLETFKSQAATWFIGAVIAILTVFSGKIVESLKFSLNRANLRTKNGIRSGKRVSPSHGGNGMIRASKGARDGCEAGSMGGAGEALAAKRPDSA
jgi:hypothetical protein